MVGLEMKRPTKGGSGPKKMGSEKLKKGALKVDPADSQTVNLVAKYRGLSVENLFKEEDVRTFWKNLLATEQRKKME